MKEEWEDKWNSFKEYMRKRFRMTIRDKAYEEKFSIEFSRWNAWIAAGLSIILLIAITTVLIAFTPLREYIPGYGSTKQARKLFSLQVQLDSLNNRMQAYKSYVDQLQLVLGEDYSADSAAFQSKESPTDKAATFAFSKEDSMLLSMTTREASENASPAMSMERKQKADRHLLFQPVTGKIYRPHTSRHKDILLQTFRNQPIHAVDEGIVVCATPNILCIQHPENRLSIYRQYGHLLVRKGESVRSGQIVAETGKDSLTSFEWWENGKNINPQTRFSFE